MTGYFTEGVNDVLRQQVCPMWNWGLYSLMYFDMNEIL